MRPFLYVFHSYPARDTREEPHPLRQPSCDGRVGHLNTMYEFCCKGRGDAAPFYLIGLEYTELS